MNSPYALLAITRHGCKLALDISSKISPELNPIELYFPEKFKQEFDVGIDGNPSPHFYAGKVKDLLERIFNSYQGIIAIISLGALIRLIAPLIRDKKTDPAVVVIDEKGEYVISVLSGHIGGGNELTRVLAEKIGARPVITTASDVQKTLSVDLLGKEFNWFMEKSEFLTEVSAAVVNDEPVAIVQESGEENWWPYQSALPANLALYNNIDMALNSNAEYYIIITHRDLPVLPEFEILSHKKIVVFHPRVIGLGLGCNRNTSEEEIENVVLETLHELNFSMKSVCSLASIDLKNNEPGLLSFCNKMNLKPVFYPAAMLNSVNIENPSETVFKHTGAYGVSEPAAKLLTGNDNLVLVKKISGNVTISVGLFKAI